MTATDLKTRGFTLVELAIVVTIVALLIGGVLKGQELLENSKVQSAGIKIKSAEVAFRTFRDIYHDLPGDITNPSGRLNSCTSSPCSVGGNGNGWIGYNTGQSSTTYTSTSENNTFWLHLRAAGLMPDLPPADADGVTYFVTGLGSSGGFLQIQSWPYENNSTHWWYLGYKRPSSAPAADIPTNVLGKYDLKYDDGKPFNGNVFINSVCGTLTASSTAYDPNDNSRSCLLQVRTQL